MSSKLLFRSNNHINLIRVTRCLLESEQIVEFGLCEGFSVHSAAMFGVFESPADICLDCVCAAARWIDGWPPQPPISESIQEGTAGGGRKRAYILFLFLNSFASPFITVVKLPFRLKTPV